MAGSIGLSYRTRPSNFQIKNALINASRPKIIAATQFGADVAPRLIAAYASAGAKHFRPPRSTPSLTSPSSYRATVRPSREGASLNIHVVQHSNEFMAKFYSVNNGARPHPIRAVNAPNLVFPFSDGSGIFKGPRVNHPGNAGRKFFQKGAKDAYQTILAALR